MPFCGDDWLKITDASKMSISKKQMSSFVVFISCMLVSSYAIEEESCGCGGESLTRTEINSVLDDVQGITQYAGSCENAVLSTRETVRTMSTRHISQELIRRGKSTKDLKEKEDFVRALARLSSNHTFTEEMIFVPGGAFIMGTNKPAPYPADAEGPPRIVAVSDFYLDKDAVTNSQFLEFVTDTGYETESEKFGWSFVFNMSLSEDAMRSVTQQVEGVPWWLPVNGATWRLPEGPLGDDVFTKTPSPDYPGGRSNHAVVHVSWGDAQAYCKWRNESSLPTEAQWEYAMKYVDQGVSFRTLYPWGDEAEPISGPRMNIWQGNFPVTNDAWDGWRFTSPSDAFEAQTPLGFRNLLGNVWEWVEDWWGVDHKAVLAEMLRTGLTTEIGVVSDPNTLEPVNRTVALDPKGPTSGTEKAKRGGSFLCHESFCFRYRPSARHKNTPDSATSNNGFRCARYGSAL